MARPLLPDDLWDVIAPLLPPPRPRPKGGRRPIENRAALTGILFVLRSGLPWEMLPAEMGCGCGMSCWRRLRDWQEAGVWGACIRSCWSACTRRVRSTGVGRAWTARLFRRKGALPPARTRRTGASRARSATSSPTRVARRSASA
ncbi:transposase [Methylobacterium oryzae CBMB20]